MVVIRSYPNALAPQPARDDAEVALHDEDHVTVHVLNAGATAVDNNSGQANQQGKQGAAAAAACKHSAALVPVVCSVLCSKFF